MSINSVHPAYQDYKDKWELLHDFYEGEQHVKSLEDKYLLPTAGMILDGMKPKEIGRLAYENYLARAVFPDYIKDAVEIAIGLLHQKEAVINLPPELEILRDKASNKKESLNQLLRRINVEQLTAGRCGLLIDLPTNVNPANPIPYIALYKAESIINWDESNDYIGTDEVNLIVLDETGLRRSNNAFNWKVEIQHRVLTLTDSEPMYSEESGMIDSTNFKTRVYKEGIFNNETGFFSEEALVTPAIRGKTLDKIPFTFVNSKDLLPLPENPPLLGLANTTWAIYRGEADYRHSLFMQGQDTLVVIGSVRNPNIDPTGADAIRTGAGSRIDLDVSGDAKYIGVSSKGLAEQRTCLENDRTIASTKAGNFIGNQANVESGRALSVRLAAKTATLNQIALSGAIALENCLKDIAEWIGADSSKVQVIPNMDFTKIEFQGQELVNIMTARGMGAPISLESIHATLVNRGMTDLDYQTEISKIPEENQTLSIPEPNAGTKVPSQPNQLPIGTNQPPKQQHQNQKP